MPDTKRTQRGHQTYPFSGRDPLPLQRLYLHHFFFKLFAGHGGFIFYPRFVTINRFDGVLQDLGDLFRIGDSHAHEGENAQAGTEDLHPAG